jgi:ATP-dependent Lon protease
MLPARNRRDLEDIPESARRELKFVWMERVEDAVASAIEQPTGATPPLSATGT